MKHRLTLLILAVVLLASCRSIDPLPDGFVELTIKEDTHRATPYRFIWKERTYLAYEWRFDESAAYELGDHDQCDWNKLGILSLHKFANLKNSSLVGWRYDRDGFLWVAPYYHEDGQTFWARTPCSDLTAEVVDPDLQAIRVDIGDIVEVHINVNSHDDWTALTIINTVTGATSFWEKHWEKDFDKTREVYPWFGGNRKAPHDITIYRRLIADE